MSSAIFRPSQVTHASAPTLRRGTYFVQTWGCQMNEEDSEQIALSLESIGFTPAASVLEAHVIILNTCSVRKKPEDKAFSMLGELALMKASRSEVVVGVCGCMAQMRADEIRRRAPHVDFVVGTAQIVQIAGLVEEALQRRKFQKRVAMPERKGAVVTDIPRRIIGRSAKLKAFVPIQYGCDKFCSFCIVPTTRGRERSRPSSEIVEEITGLAAAGTKEVTLLGQTVNSYGKNLMEGRVPFGKLLQLVSEVPGIERIRFTSPYPRDFKSDLITVIRDCPQVMEHCHMPLQSGENEMLKAMKRLYTVESFTEIVNELREMVPGVIITTDMIVGYPGESEEQFQATLQTMRDLKFYGAYMFAYSPRPGTPAAELEQVPDDVKKRRLNEMIEMQSEITVAYNKSFIGREFEVMVEGPSLRNKAVLQGYSREFVMCHFAGSPDLAGQIVKVRATEGSLYGVAAELI